MRLKKNILLVVYAGVFLAIGLASVIFHFTLKSEHSIICFCINAGMIATLALGALYIFRGYQKKDNKILNAYTVACIASVITELVYCVELGKTYPLFSKWAIIGGGTNIAILGALLLGKDFSKKKLLCLVSIVLFETVILVIGFAIIAGKGIFVDHNISNITTFLDLIISTIFASILCIAVNLKIKDKEERKVM